jgi:DNA-binding ferritin-like protein
METAPTANHTQLSVSLNQVLADSYALMSLTHLAHWNVEGPGFFALHAAFQMQYEELFTAIDEIAERVRALGAYATGGLGKLAQTAQMAELLHRFRRRTTSALSLLGTESWSSTRQVPATSPAR